MSFTINPYTGKFDRIGLPSGATISAADVTISAFLTALLDGATNVEDALRELEERTRYYAHSQPVAATVWTIPHNLDIPIPPAITVIDSPSGDQVIGYNITVIDPDTLQLTFCYPVSGFAYLIR